MFLLMVHLRPAPVAARVATPMPRLRTPIAPWLEREISVTTYLAEQARSHPDPWTYPTRQTKEVPCAARRQVR
jgi:hypothetical protein